jgi:hypothetical protein
MVAAASRPIQTALLIRQRCRRSMRTQVFLLVRNPSVARTSRVDPLAGDGDEVIVPDGQRGADKTIFARVFD